MIDRYGAVRARNGEPAGGSRRFPTILLLPGSRPGELRRHTQVLVGALDKIRSRFPQMEARMVLSSEELLSQAKEMGLPAYLQSQIGDLPAALAQADLALASTGTVTLECAYFGVPAIALYKTSFLTWEIAKRIITVQYGAMPNLLADRELFPEFIQDNATSDNIAQAAIALLQDEPRRKVIQEQLPSLVASLGTPGAAQRAAQAVLSLVKEASPN
jgi:lipid-A-disaccharide synthase